MAMGENIRELLGAYLCADITPEERVAVERLLAADSGAQAEARELQALLGLLSRGERTVSPALVSALRLRVEKACAEKLREPEVDLQALQGFMRFLKQGERPVPEELGRKLAARLSVALPGAGIGGAVSKRSARAASRREAAQTARVYFVPSSAWRGRLAWAGVAAAALLALVFGLARLFDHGTRGGPARVQRAAGPEPNPAQAGQDAGQLVQTPTGQTNERETANTVVPVVPAHKPPAPENAVARELAGKTEQERDVPGPTVPPVPVAPEKAVEIAPKETAPAPRLANTDVPKKAPEVNTKAPQPAPETNVSQMPPRPSGGGTGAGGGGSVGVQQSPSPAPSPTTPAIQVPVNVAVVMATRDGNVQALTPDGRTLTLAENQAVPSGSQIITDQGRVGLKLPGDNMLWVNGGSSLTLSYSGQATSVSLNRGEIAYKTPQGTGSLAVTATGVEVKDAKAVDMKIEDNAAKVSVLDKQALVGPKGRPSKIKGGTKAIVPLTGIGQTHTEAIVGRPDSWTDDLFPMLPTNDKNLRGKSRPPSKRR